MIKEMANGLYCIRVHIKKNGRHIYRRKDGVKTLREAKQIERDLYNEAHTETNLTRIPTCGELVAAWFDDPETLTHYSPGTRDRYYYGMERGFNQDWAKRQISDIKRQEIIHWLDTYVTSRELSQATKNYQKKLISVIFEYAIQRGYIEHNPCAGLRIREGKKPELNIWSKEQLETFLSGVKRLDKDWYLVFTLAALTGMRAGELIALRWENVDMAHKTITICEVYDHKLRVIRKGTKNTQTRCTPINNALNTILAQMNPDGPFVAPRLVELLGGGAARVLKDFARVLGLPPIRFHDFRAIFACQLALSGVPMHVIKAICGWSNLSVVQRYLRISGAEIQGATDRLDIKI